MTSFALTETHPHGLPPESQGAGTLPSWTSVKMINHNHSSDTVVYPRPDYSVNIKYPEVKEVWRVQEKSDTGTGSVMAGSLLIVTGTDGSVRALDIKSGQQKWQFATGAKIYSTPAVSGKKVIAAATDGKVYALKLKSGKKEMELRTSQQPMVAAPVIHGDRVYITGSSGKCYALRLKDGSVIWSNNLIDGFVETIPDRL